MDAHDFTTQPVAATWGADAEWVEHRGLKNMFSIGRSAAYVHVLNGDFESKVLRRKGCIKGRRLYNVASVRAFLASLRSDVDPRLSAKCKKANKASIEAKREKAEREKEKPKLKGKS